MDSMVAVILKVVITMMALLLVVAAVELPMFV
uniref:Uncharacterized protein n=1 Tax=virus sp. ct8MV80 TaxID=2826793 RepID=A0A8S5R8A0_9VIRU|nr:MAG TPA: hypothetical protein [virus sp. ct8MV80]DAO37900.1 MAG TPA: hypothetical protein [Caudoviricetes sp.]